MEKRKSTTNGPLPTARSRLAAPGPAATTANRLRLCVFGVAFILSQLHGVSITVTALGDERIPPNPPLRWWKGNLHTHSLWSDGNDFPEMISEWYRTHDYNFLAISDHNETAAGMRWMPLTKIDQRSGEAAFAKYRARFGDDWIETREIDSSADQPQLEVRLKPFDEYRSLLEERGKFILLRGEEISDSVQGKPVHMNATNLQELIQPLGGATVAEAMRANLRAAADQATRTGREIIVHLNHPNFHYAITAEDLARVVEERFFEVYNGHPGVNHLGDEEHPSVERIWDLANAIRLTQFPGADPLLGVATDDSHEYHNTKGSTPGRGWIMVRTRHLTPESILRAMNAADFYASSGVALADVVFNARDRSLTVSVLPDDGVDYRIEFIGTRYQQPTNDAPTNDTLAMPASDAIGIRLATIEGTEATYRANSDELYVRAVVTSNQPHPNPSYPEQTTMAWTQPFVTLQLEKQPASR